MINYRSFNKFKYVDQKLMNNNANELIKEAGEEYYEKNPFILIYFPKEIDISKDFNDSFWKDFGKNYLNVDEIGNESGNNKSKIEIVNKLNPAVVPHLIKYYDRKTRIAEYNKKMLKELVRNLKNKNLVRN